MSLLSVPAGKPMGERKRAGYFVMFTLQSFVSPSLMYAKWILKSVMQKWCKSVVCMGCKTVVFGRAWGTSSKIQFNWKMPFHWTYNFLLQISTAEQIPSALNNESDKDISFTENPREGV